MSDIQLFRLGGGKVQELPGKAAAIEKDLQMLIESHMETFLGVRFLETNTARVKPIVGELIPSASTKITAR